MNKSGVVVIVALLSLTAGCAGVDAPTNTTASDTPPASTTTTSTTATTTTYQIDRYLKLETTAFGPLNVSIRIEKLYGEQELVNETRTVEVGDTIEYTDHLEDGVTYLVVVETPTETQRHILRPYQALTFIIKDDGVIEREMEVD